MHTNNTNDDLRSVKTEKALYAAIFSLLKNQSFKKTTVKEICEKALISRAAFYAHFIDKYDLLKQWMRDLWAEKFKCCNTYEEAERAFNTNTNERRRILKNLIYDADNETFEILFDFILSTRNLGTDKNSSDETYRKNIALSNFYAGGIISYLLWQIKNEFPPDVPFMNKEFYQLVNEFKNKLLK